LPAIRQATRRPVDLLLASVKTRSSGFGLAARISDVSLPRIDPLELGRLPEAFDHDEWLFELKHDGFRAVAYLEGGDCRLVSRTRHVYRQFGELQKSLTSALLADEAIIDGEVVCLDDDGRPVFDDLFRRRGAPCYVAFDLMWLDGEDLRDLLLIERKRRLRDVIPKRSAFVLYLDHVEARGEELFRLVCEQDLEGIVAKLKRAPYRAGAISPWLKIKNSTYSQGEGRFEKLIGPRSNRRR
jgi:bifunctional non-homologous end joining protein LigD